MPALTPRIAGVSTMVAVLLLAAPTGVVAGMLIERVGQEEGPMPDVVTALCRDRSGLVWIGSRDGLRLFDGETIRRFDHDASDPASLSDNTIRVVHEDRDGRLWVGTNSGGLDLLDRGHWRFEAFRHDPSDPSSLSHDSVYDVLEDRAGSVWVGTQHGLNRLAPGGRSFTRFMAAPGGAANALASDYIVALHADGAGRLWIATEGGGLSVLDPASGSITTLRSRPSDAATLSSDRVSSLCEEPPGVLWVGTVAGLDRLDLRDMSIRRVPWDRSAAASDAKRAPLIRAIVRGRPGALWIGTNEDGVLELDLATATLRRASARDPAWPDSGSRQIEALLTDPDGSLWIGTWGGGLRRMSAMALAFAGALRLDAVPTGLANTEVTAIRSDRSGGAWFGTADGAVVRAGAPGAAGRAFGLHPGPPVTALDLAQDREGRIWYGTSRDLRRLDPATGRTVTFAHDPGDESSIGPGFVRIVTFDRQERLWIGTGEGGVQRLDAAGRVVERHRNVPGDASSLSDDYVTAIHEDDDGGLWVGTRSGGLNILDVRTGRVERFQPEAANPESLGHHYVTAIHRDQRGRTWVATAGGGIALALPGQAPGSGAARPGATRLRFRRFGENDGLVDDDVMGIVEDDDGSLWLPTHRGLARFDPEGPRFVSIHASDGLPSAEFEAGCAARIGGLLYFGTIKGPIALLAGTPFPVVRPSTAIVSAIRTPAGEVLGEQPPWSRGRLSVPYGEWLAVDLAVLDYVPGPLHRFAYRLGGDWIDLGPTRQITFTQLKPATYTFSARGRNNSGVWSPPTAAMTIEVVPPFWMTGWFRGAAILGFLAAAVGVHRGRLAAVEGRHRALVALTEQRERARSDLAAAYERLSLLTRRLEAAKEDERQRIARELHDDMGPSLTAVIINLQLLIRGAAEGVAARIHDSIAIVDRLVQRVRDLSLDLRPPLLDELGLGDALRGYLEAQAARAGLEIRVDAGDGLGDLPREIQVHAFRIVQEAVTNAIRHAAARRVEVRIRRDGDHVELSVKDDGRGFDAGAVLGSGSGKSVGLMGMQERVRSLGGTLQVDAAPGRGTAITARVPAVEAA